VAPRFLDWLAVPANRRWLDVGCGTGALSAAIPSRASPAAVADEDVLDPGVEQAVRLGVRGDRRAGRVDALGVGVALRLGQVVDDVGEDRLGCLEAERGRVANVELEDLDA